MLAGRLSQEEFEERLERAYKATTRGDLDALTDGPADQPQRGSRVRAGAARRSMLRRRLVQEAGAARRALSGVRRDLGRPAAPAAASGRRG